ncbi:DM13 domain-containing protein [Longirhabdus pacifica]|uniref:DM13 domain-containing protein n=1 Tax=Longirhabdus pacifica TaxID=2305227 RepID=UPI001980D05B|nr:DM13 domain-containing protein [Longirhabdus pacifica]
MNLWKKLGLGVVGVGILAVGWWLVSPLFIDDVVNEPVPGAAMSDEMKDDEMMEDKDGMSEDMKDEMMEDKDGMSEDMNDEMMEDKDGMSEDMNDEMMEDKDGMSEDLNDEMMEDKDGMSEDMNDEMMEDTMSATFSGDFVNADDDHSASGNAYTIVGEDTNYLRFENFETTNGPDLYVYLVSSDAEATSDGISLGKLKGNVGDQNYELPDGIDLSTYNKVVIYCKSFSVDFGYATLTTEM